MTYSNRFTTVEPVTEAYFDEHSMFITVRDVSFVLPLNTLTERISADPDVYYELEYHQPTMLLGGIREPESTYLYRVTDEWLYRLAQNPVHLNRLFRDGRTLDPAEIITDLLANLTPDLKSRLKSLPKEYLDEYLIYELKVSYLASSPVKPYLFDPTQQELSAAVGLALRGSTEYPQLINHMTS